MCKIFYSYMFLYVTEFKTLENLSMKPFIFSKTLREILFIDLLD